MNPRDTVEFQMPVKELVVKGLLRESLSSCVIPTLLGSQKNGSIRMYVDSRAINKITIKYKHLIPILEYIC